MTDLGHPNMFDRRSLLEEEEDRLVEALSTVRSRLNELAPISSLPPEIFEEIFDICVSWLYGYQKPKHRLAWSQVCSSWRRISFSSSRLWQRIDLCNSRFADEFLVRSKHAPLFITSTSPLKLTTNNLTDHAKRLQSIDVFLFPDDMAQLFSSIGRDLPNLTTLSLKIPPVSSTLSLDLSLPQVRRLSLDGVAIRWDDCRNLASLSLRGLTPESSPSIPQLHDILAASPHLQYIRLESLLSPTLDVVPRRNIPLMNLKDFIISSKPSSIRAILSGIYLGPHTRLQLYLSLSENLQTVFPHGLPYLPSSNFGSTRNSLDVGTIRLSRHGAHFLRPNTAAWSEDTSKVLFALSSASPLSTHVCESLNHMLDLRLIKNLELNTGVLLDIPRPALENLFKDLYNVETLRMAFNDLESLFSVLQIVEELTGIPYLPHLTAVTFSKPSDLWWHFGDRWMEAILETLTLRQAHSIPIETLEFFRCRGLSETIVEELEKIVPRIIVREQAGKRSPSDFYRVDR